MSGSATTNLPSNADGYSAEFDGNGGPLTIHISTAATTSPVGVFRLQQYNAALADWETNTDAAVEMAKANPAAGAASYVVNFSDSPKAKLRVFYDSTSDGAAAVGSIVIEVRVGREP